MKWVTFDPFNPFKIEVLHIPMSILSLPVRYTWFSGLTPDKTNYSSKETTSNLNWYHITYKIGAVSEIKSSYSKQPQYTDRYSRETELVESWTPTLLQVKYLAWQTVQFCIGNCLFQSHWGKGVFLIDLMKMFLWW